jgi:hypothetical protein
MGEKKYIHRVGQEQKRSESIIKSVARESLHFSFFLFYFLRVARFNPFPVDGEFPAVRR